MADAESTAALFTGRWIGETQGYDAPAHVWEISQRRHYLLISTRWEHETGGIQLSAVALAGESAFQIGDQFKAVLVDPQHFIIQGWDTNDTRSGAGPDYDVVFSRPGIAELTARAVWLKYIAAQPAPSSPEQVA